jgi:hypothetical protein
MSLHLVTFDGSRCTAGRVGVSRPASDDSAACRSGWDEYTAARKYLPYYILIILHSYRRMLLLRCSGARAEALKSKSKMRVEISTTCY